MPIFYIQRQFLKIELEIGTDLYYDDGMIMIHLYQRVTNSKLSREKKIAGPRSCEHVCELAV